jgi:Rod binding domain-containing protein
MQISALASAAGLAQPTTTSSGSTKIKDAATQFEAILLQQMLQSARAAGGGDWMGQDEAGSALSEMAEQQFSEVLARNGGLGIAKLVSSGLEVK